MKHSESLAGLLRRAEDWLRRADPPTLYTRYSDAASFADQLATWATAMEAGRLTDAQRSALLEIFSPTCDWDDVAGDPALGQTIFDMLESGS